MNGPKLVHSTLVKAVIVAVVMEVILAAFSIHFACVLLLDYLKEAVAWFRRSSKHWAGAITILTSVTVT